MLLREYAIDPQVMADWETSKALYEGMGACHGRMWNPVWPQKSWKAKVRELVDQAEQSETIGQIYCKSIREKHLPYLEKTMWPARPNLAETVPWVDAVKSTHATHNYHAIISDAPLTGHPALPPGELSNHDPRWKVDGTTTVSRTASGLTESVKGILHTSAQLVFVDPYFGTRLSARAMWEPMTLYIKTAYSMSGIRSQPLEWIEIHTEKKLATTTTPDKWLRFVQGLGLPAGVKISLAWWDERALHNRYILGNLCGASFGTGLDMASASSTQTDTISRLSDEVRTARWDKYVNQADEWRRSAPDRIW